MHFRRIKGLFRRRPFFHLFFPFFSMYDNIDENTHLLRFNKKRDSTTTASRRHSSTTLHDTIEETISILSLAWPLLITFVVGYGMKLVDVWFLGRLDTESKS